MCLKEVLVDSQNSSIIYNHADYQGAQVSLDTTHALLQTQVAKSEEESEVNN